MTELTCEDLEAHLTDFLEGALDSTTVDAATKHLAECDNCRVTVSQTEQVRDLGARHGRLTLGPEARQRIRQRLDDGAI